MALQDRLFIGGEFVDAVGGGTVEVRNPHDGSLLAEVAEGQAADVDRAVEAAQRAFPAWAATAAAERGRVLFQLADAIEAHADELARLESTDTGHPLKDTTLLDVPRTAAAYRYFGGIADKFEGSVVPVDAGFLNYVRHEPIGVVGAIVPWNFPLLFTSWKLGPALAAGNTAVMKPSELVPLSTLRLCELMVEVGLPPGVVNVVPGYGHDAGARLAAHPGVGKVSFTGSTRTGRSVVEASAGNLKRLQLELGGKGANVVYADADLDAAVNGAAFGIFHNQGQACIAGSRLLLHEAVADEFLDRFLALAGSIRVGDPLAPGTEMGPLTSPEHRDRVLSFVKVAEDEGGEILLGGDRARRSGPGRRLLRAPDRGARRAVGAGVPGGGVRPVRHRVDVRRRRRGAGVGQRHGLRPRWQPLDPRPRPRAPGRRRVPHRDGVGQLHQAVGPGSPFGGVGQSGYGREMGFEAMRGYTEPKSVWVNVDAAIPAWYPRS